MNKKIFMTRAIPQVCENMLKEKGYQVDVYDKDQIIPKKVLINTLKKGNYDGLVCLLTDEIDSSVYNSSPNLKIVSTYTVGFNNIDVEEAKKRGITITNTAGTSRTPVAEHALALMLALTTRLVEADSYARAGKYNGWSPTAFMGTDLTGKTIGLVGVGGIGGEMARILKQAFNSKIQYYDVIQHKDVEEKYGALRLNTLDELLKTSDIVSLHVPLMPTTHHLINSEAISKMKNTAFLINTSRGAVIDELALVDALKKGVIAGAGLDVFEFEPKISKGLFKLKNVVLTPHIASARDTTRDEMAKLVALNMIDFFEGRKPRNAVA